MLIDTHCHLDFPEFDADREDVLRRAQENGIGSVINIGSSLKGSQNSVHLARQYDQVYAAVGIHPHEADSFKDEDLSIIRDLASAPKVVAIGEIGLDLYKNYSASDNQERMFHALVSLAKERSLPVVIHNRQADPHVLAILRKYAPLKGVIHCFSGDAAFMDGCLEMGFYVSFTCNITYKKADNLRDMVKRAPLDRIMLETDAPYLPPQAFRGRRNEPCHVKDLAVEVAGLKGVSLEQIARVTSDNAAALFKIK